MRYTLEELREYRDLLEQIEVLEGAKEACKVCEKRETNFKRSLKERKGGQFWTEERRRAQSERMKNNKRWKGERTGELLEQEQISYGPQTEEEYLLDVALVPLPEGASGRKRIPRDYRCSICNGEGHNARTCTTLDDASTPPGDGI